MEPPTSPTPPSPLPWFPMGQPTSTGARAGQAPMGCLRRLRGCVVLLAAFALVVTGGLWLLSLIFQAPAVLFVNPLPYLNQYHFVIHHGQTLVHSTAWSPDGTRIASVADDGSIQLWDAATGNTRWSYHAQRGVEIPLVWSPDGKRLALADAAHDLVVLDAASGRVTLEVPGKDEHSVAWSPDSQRIAAFGAYPNVQVWDVASGQVIQTLDAGGANEVAWSPDGKYLACNADGVRVWDAESGKTVLQTKPENFIETSWGLAWSPDSKKIASHVLGTQQVREQVWEVATGKSLFTDRVSTSSTDYLVVAWSPDSRSLAIGGEKDDTIGVWDLATGSKRVTYNGHRLASLLGQSNRGATNRKGGVVGVVWSPDGRYIASLGDEDTIQVWDPSTGNPLATYDTYTDMSLLPGRDRFATNGAWSVAWSPDGKRIAVAGDNFAEVWQPW